MPEHLAPGVYVEEVPFRSRTIEGVATGIAAFLGQAPRGPVGKPVKLASLADFAERFGRPAEGRELALSVQLFFANGGRVAHIVRTAPGKGPAAKPPDAAALIGEKNRKTGLHAFDRVGTFNLLVLPDTARLTARAAAKVAKAAAAYARSRQAFYLMDAPRGAGGRDRLEGAAAWLADNPGLRQPDAALYLPSLRSSAAGGGLLVSPGGAMAGLYARNDAERGVWTAPAGIDVRLRGVDGLETTPDDAESERFGKLGINLIREFPGRGILPWGARTLEGDDASGSEWKYVPVRRFFVFLERSIYRGIQWAVFEPNDEPLWAQIRLNVSSFMNAQWRRGALQGTDPRAAYFVKCDRETMTEADIAAGILNITVGFAPLRPAEFVIISIKQKTADA